jgi:hypothetical protein
MKLTTKKTIARELLFLFALFAIATLAWVGVIIYNYTLQTKIDYTENELVIANKKLDSLKLQKFYTQIPKMQLLYGALIKNNYELPSFSKFKENLKDEKELNRTYNKLINEFDLPDYNTFKVNMSETKQVRIYINGNQNTLKDFYVTIYDKPYLSDDELLTKFPEFESDKDAIRIAREYIEVLNRNPNFSREEIDIVFPEFSRYQGLPTLSAAMGELIDSPIKPNIDNHFKLVTEQKNVVSEIKLKRNNLKNPLANDEIEGLIIKFLLYGFLILFGGRYLYAITKWAIKTVKE